MEFFLLTYFPTQTLRHSSQSSDIELYFCALVSDKQKQRTLIF